MRASCDNKVITAVKNQQSLTSPQYRADQQKKSGEFEPQGELFDRLEGELGAIVETFQRERHSLRRENEQLRQMLQERDVLITQIQSEVQCDKERMVHQWQREKNLQQQSILTLREDMSRMEGEFERLQTELTKRDADLSSLSQQKASFIDKLAGHESKREEWRRTTKQLEDYFNQHLEGIRNNFDLQLRDLIDKQRQEINILEDALQHKQERIDQQGAELDTFKSQYGTQLQTDLLRRSDQSEALH